MIIDLGLIGYEECYALQKQLVARRKSGGINDCLILAEHDEIFTIGRTGSEKNILVRPEDLSDNRMKVLRVDRGGDVTFHGPGQLVAYPIIDLKARGKDLHRYLRDLEEAVMLFLGDYSVDAERIRGKTGVWVHGKKISSIGIGASGRVTYHGVSVNINCELNFFSMINPCGMADVVMTSLARVKRRNIDMGSAKKIFVKRLSSVLGIDDKRSYIGEAALA